MQHIAPNETLKIFHEINTEFHRKTQAGTCKLRRVLSPVPRPFPQKNITITWVWYKEACHSSEGWNPVIAIPPRLSPSSSIRAIRSFHFCSRFFQKLDRVVSFLLKIFLKAWSCRSWFSSHFAAVNTICIMKAVVKVQCRKKRHKLHRFCTKTAPSSKQPAKVGKSIHIRRPNLAQ